MKAWAAEGKENCDKRNVFHQRNVVVESMGCRGGGGNFDKRNVFHKRNVVESMGCRGEGENCDKRNVFDKRNVVVESMGCRGGGENFDKRKSGRVAQRQMCVGYVVGCRGGGGEIVIKGMFLIKGML